MQISEGRLTAGGTTLSSLTLTPPDPAAVVVFAHGAGAGMHHATMTAIAEAFARVDLATFRFQFPYMQAGRRRVDRIADCVAALGAAAAAAAASGLPIFLGGHSFGGRMATHAAAPSGGVDCDGLILCSFPLHPRGKPSIDRAAHLDSVSVPMLFMTGTRDALADAALLTDVVARLGEKATLHWLETADHSYRTLKRTRTSKEDIFDEMARVARAFVATSIPSPADRS